MITEALHTVEHEFRDFILKRQHPCLMAKTVFLMDKYHIKVYDDIRSEEVIQPVLSNIATYLENYDFDSNEFETLIICFKNNDFKTEKAFESALWKFLQNLHDHDDKGWDPEVSKNPEDSNFSFSLKGKAFYIVGLHPNSSRIARQAPYCTLVFNLHWQFERLREMGTYQAVKTRIRRRDKKLQGHINPVLKDFGKDSETKQYSGREVESNWKCPFHIKTKQ